MKWEMGTLKKRWKLGEEEAGGKEFFNTSLRSPMALSAGRLTMVDSPVSVRTWICISPILDKSVLYLKLQVCVSFASEAKNGSFFREMICRRSAGEFVLLSSSLKITVARAEPWTGET